MLTVAASSGLPSQRAPVRVPWIAGAHPLGPWSFFRV